MSEVNLVWVTPNADQMIGYIARVSNVSAKPNDEAAPLISYLIKHKHWSPFTMANMCLEIFTERDISRQILRHKSLQFQEFCVAGNTMITFEVPHESRKGKRCAYKIPIKRLYNSFVRKMKIPQIIRVFDENNRTFTTSKVLAVSQNGVKPTFRVTLENGKKIECTKEHKFLTESGFLSLEEAVGLKIIGKTAVMEKPETAFACNGIPIYRDSEWLSSAKQRAISNGKGLSGIVEEAGCTVHTIRKWLKNHGLQFTKLEVASYTPIWNKGVSGYIRPRHSNETIEKMKLKARRGADSNLWRGGVSRSERMKIADWCNANRTGFLKAVKFKCEKCSSSKKLQLHHIVPVSVSLDLAYDKNNIQVLCHECHQKEHKLKGHRKMWREKSNGNSLTVHWSKIRHIEYVGEQMTYDLEVEHSSHNYVANGIVVHNSQRYMVTSTLPEAPNRPARMQDPKNRQKSKPCRDQDLMNWWDEAQTKIKMEADAVYNTALEMGVAKEVARSILPEGLTTTRMYVNGDIRSWLHYCEVRRGNGTQPEHIEVADKCYAILKNELPDTVAAWEASISHLYP